MQHHGYQGCAMTSTWEDGAESSIGGAFHSDSHFTGTLHHPCNLWILKLKPPPCIPGDTVLQQTFEIGRMDCRGRAHFTASSSTKQDGPFSDSKSLACGPHSTVQGALNLHGLLKSSRLQETHGRLLRPSIGAKVGLAHYWRFEGSRRILV